MTSGIPFFFFAFLVSSAPFVTVLAQAQVIMVVGRWDRTPAYGTFTRASTSQIKTSPAFLTLQSKKVLIADPCDGYRVFDSGGGYLICAGSGSIPDLFIAANGYFALANGNPMCAPTSFVSYTGPEAVTLRVAAAATVYVGQCNAGFDPAPRPVNERRRSCDGATIGSGNRCGG